MADPNRDPRVDAYIAARAPFARPILERLRAIVHAADPEIAETIKWSMPFFVRRGRMLCHMAAFKQHAAFGLWHGRALVGEAARDGAMGQFGRIASLDDLPDEATLTALLREAMALSEAAEPAPRANRPPKPPAETPAELAAHFAADPSARAIWDGWPPGQRREYCDWIAEAKRPETRARRVAQACDWIGDGKRRNWKHERG